MRGRDAGVTSCAPGLPWAARGLPERDRGSRDGVAAPAGEPEASPGSGGAHWKVIETPLVKFDTAPTSRNQVEKCQVSPA